MIYFLYLQYQPNAPLPILVPSPREPNAVPVSSEISHRRPAQIQWVTKKDALIMPQMYNLTFVLAFFLFGDEITLFTQVTARTPNCSSRTLMPAATETAWTAPATYAPPCVSNCLFLI